MRSAPKSVVALHEIAMTIEGQVVVISRDFASVSTVPLILEVFDHFLWREWFEVLLEVTRQLAETYEVSGQDFPPRQTFQELGFSAKGQAPEELRLPDRYLVCRIAGVVVPKVHGVFQSQNHRVTWFGEKPDFVEAELERHVDIESKIHYVKSCLLLQQGRIEPEPSAGSSL